MCDSSLAGDICVFCLVGHCGLLCGGLLFSLFLIIIVPTVVCLLDSYLYLWFHLECFVMFERICLNVAPSLCIMWKHVLAINVLLFCKLVGMSGLNGVQGRMFVDVPG